MLDEAERSPNPFPPIREAQAGRALGQQAQFLAPRARLIVQAQLGRLVNPRAEFTTDLARGIPQLKRLRVHSLRRLSWLALTQEEQGGGSGKDRSAQQHHPAEPLLHPLYSNLQAEIVVLHMLLIQRKGEGKSEALSRSGARLGGTALTAA